MLYGLTGSYLTPSHIVGNKGCLPAPSLTVGRALKVSIAVNISRLLLASVLSSPLDTRSSLHSLTNCISGCLQ